MSDDEYERQIETEVIDPDAPVKFVRVTDGDEELALIPWGDAEAIAKTVERCSTTTEQLAEFLDDRLADAKHHHRRDTNPRHDAITLGKIRAYNDVRLMFLEGLEETEIEEGGERDD